MGKLFKVLVILVILAAVTAGGYAFVRGSRNGDSKFKLVEAKTDSITEKAVAVGQVQPRQEFQVKSKISGIVERTFVEVGDSVKAGDPLFEIAPDPTPLEVSEVDRRLESAQASFNRAKSDLDRATELSNSGVTPRSELDAKREAFELARISLLKAQQDRQLTRQGRTSVGTERLIRAPAGGTILSRLVNPGDPVVPLTSFQPGTELATIADMSDLIFRGTVDEIDVGKLQAGLIARIKVGALPSDVVTGRVSRIAPQAEQKDGATLFNVEIELDSAANIVLRAGYSANADLIIREKKDVLTVPERLVTFEDGGQKAFVEIPGATPDAEPTKVEIKTGISDGMNVEVLSGLSKGAQVVERPPKEIS
ncbi:MAG TPA: efflux RND transporter periplasmic adaptor subunit [Thermoanaerobaculia bacterium]|nr:efflux RND transporter periplasmic adaptor subunit [Thermoanaerobaculia bacterium]